MTKLSRREIIAQTPHALRDAAPLSEALGLPAPYKGKVRDNFTIGDKRVLVVSDRISAFDRMLGVIPFKGEVLTQVARFWFEKTKAITPNHLLSVPDPQVMVAREAKTVPIEMVVRSHLTGSLWRDFQAGREGAYGLDFPKNMPQYAAFEKPIITPSTKADYGAHDEPISPKDAIARGLCTADEWEHMAAAALKLFAAGAAHARTRGLVLVDTKYEFGRVAASGELIAIDEIHTPDCSRYWYDDYETYVRRGEAPRSLDKEFLRGWLLARGFKGEGEPPAIPDEVRAELAERYIELYEVLTGEVLTLHPGAVLPRVIENLRAAKVV